MDGANMNAQVGPSEKSVRMSVTNLHKTFCIPHGGGGVVWVQWVMPHLVPFLPGHSVIPTGGEALVLLPQHPGVAQYPDDFWMYIAMMGAAGLTEATKVAILNANYIARGLSRTIGCV